MEHIEIKPVAQCLIVNHQRLTGAGFQPPVFKSQPYGFQVDDQAFIGKIRIAQQFLFKLPEHPVGGPGTFGFHRNGL